ncbi:MAG TPA: rhodanese-like domain-containing protein, partial [Anaerolineaceae bacterium]|nr:rhodanese-like domain-containing protein [Anaerolineaceae bacterium]
QEGHIPGAVHIPADNIKSGLAVLNSDSWIVIYSSDVDGDILTKVGEDLLDNGFSNVNILEGGILSWKNQGFPVTSHP